MKPLHYLLIGLLLVCGIAYAQSTVYYGWNPSTGLETIHGQLVDGSPTQAITGCSLTALKGGSTAGQFTAGATTCTISMTDAAVPNGYTCVFIDMTNPTTFRQISSTTTGCSAVGTVTLSDKITFIMIGY